MALPNNFQTRNQITFPIHHPSSAKTNSREAKQMQIRDNKGDCSAPTTTLKSQILGYQNYLFWKYAPHSLKMSDQKRFSVIKALTTEVFVIQVGKYEDYA